MGAARFATAGAVMAVFLGGVLLGAPTVAVAGTAADAPAPRAVAAPPVLGGTAALTGEAVMAQELAVRLEGWADGTTFDYQWLRDGEPVDGATAAVYLPGFPDYRARISARVTATAPAGTSTVIVTDASDPVVDADGSAFAFTVVDGDRRPVRDVDVVLFTSDRLLNAETATDARGVALFEGLPASATYSVSIVDLDAGFPVFARGLQADPGELVERHLILWSSLPDDILIEGAWAGSDGAIGVYSGTPGITLVEQVGVESVESRISPPGDHPGRFADLEEVGGDAFRGTLDLSGVTGTAEVGIVRHVEGGVELQTILPVHIVAPSTLSDGEGEPVAGATITLLRADSAEGPFEPVPSGSEVLSPAVRANPVSTDAAGRFGWTPEDDGWYRIRVDVAGGQMLGEPVQAPFGEGELSATLARTGTSAPTDAARGELAATGAAASWPVAAAVMLMFTGALVTSASRRREV